MDINLSLASIVAWERRRYGRDHRRLSHRINILQHTKGGMHPDVIHIQQALQVGLRMHARFLMDDNNSNIFLMDDDEIHVGPSLA